MRPGSTTGLGRARWCWLRRAPVTTGSTEPPNPFWCRPSMHQLQRGGGLSRRQWNPRCLRLPMLFRGADDLLIGIPGPAWIPVNLRPAFSPAWPSAPKTLSTIRNSTAALPCNSKNAPCSLPCNSKNAPCSLPCNSKNAPCSLIREKSF